MDDDQIDTAAVDWEEQEGEIEALEVIFPDEFTITGRKPYKFEIQINSNAEPEENHLKMLLKVELAIDYPHSVPFMLLTNLSPDYLDNAMLDGYETEIRELGAEQLGEQMMFNLCEHLRERIAEINDKVLGKFN